MYFPKSLFASCKRPSSRIMALPPALQSKPDSLSQRRQTIEQELILNKNLLENIKSEITGTDNVERANIDTTELNNLKRSLHDKQSARQNIGQSIARIDGMISMLGSYGKDSAGTISLSVLKEEFRVVASVLDLVLNSRPDEIKNHIERIKSILHKLVTSEADIKQAENQSKLIELEVEKNKLLAEMQIADAEVVELNGKVNEIESSIQSANRNIQNKEFALRSILEREGEVKTKIALLERDMQNLGERENFIPAFEEEMAMLLGPAIIHKARGAEVVNVPSKEAHTESRRILERLKIKLEELGGIGGGEVVKEFNETAERDQFLEKEVNDIEGSIENLSNLVVDLREEMNKLFNEGILNINNVVKDFFASMFGGGNAFLSVVTEHKRKDDDDVADNKEGDFVVEQGIDINVSLPHKKVKDLHMLSGGERSLTSIALLFSMSQVTPPPFLVLDETDAALDEANSRRYGDMIERLSKLSQLVVVTHNRETMSRAGVLYGVTIGADGSSKLLSVKFDEATQYAK